MNASGLALHTIQDELRKLTAINLLKSWSNGYHRFYRANTDHAMYPLLVRMVQLSETLPQTPHSALRRPRSAGARQRGTQPKLRRMPVDRPPSWNLFSRRKTRRL